MVRDHPVNLPGHAQVKTPQAGSTCPTGIRSFAAAGAPAITVLVSPCTRTMSGGSAKRTRSIPAMIFPVCSAWLPEPASGLWSGAASSSSLKKDPVHTVRIMLAGIEHGVIRSLLPAGTDHRRHLDDLRPSARNDGDHENDPVLDQMLVNGKICLSDRRCGFFSPVKSLSGSRIFPLLIPRYRTVMIVIQITKNYNT